MVSIRFSRQACYAIYLSLSVTFSTTWLPLEDIEWTLAHFATSIELINDHSYVGVISKAACEQNRSAHSITTTLLTTNIPSHKMGNSAFSHDRCTASDFTCIPRSPDMASLDTNPSNYINNVTRQHVYAKDSKLEICDIIRRFTGL